MKIFILSLLLSLFLTGIAVSYTFTTTYELNMLDGTVLEWQTCNEEGDKFCTKKHGGLVCFEKKDIDTVIKIEDDNGKVTKTTIFKNNISEADRAKYKEKTKEDLKIARKRWAEDEKRQQALFAAKELEKLEKQNKLIKEYEKAKENIDKEIELRKTENEKYYSKKPDAEYIYGSGSDFVPSIGEWVDVHVSIETEESARRRAGWEFEKDQREALKAKGIEPDPEIRAVKRKLEPLDEEMTKVKEYVGRKEASLSVDQGPKKTEYLTSDFYYNQGIASYKNGLYDKAIEEFKKALEIKPSAEIYTNLGLAYNKKNYFTPAIDEFTKAINLDPSCKSAFLNRGATYQKKGNFDQAIEDYSKAIEIDPSYMLAYSNLADAYHKKGMYDKSKENYQKACDLGDKEGCEILKSILDKNR